MNPISFPQQTKVLQKPVGMTDKECGSLPVWCDGKQCLSVWRASFFDRVKFLFRGKIFVLVVSGQTQPPIALEIDNPFNHE